MRSGSKARGRGVGIALAALISSAALLRDSPAGDPEQAAADAYGNVQSAMGEKDAFRQNAALPLTSDATPMRTLDQTTAFSAQLTAPSSSAYLTLFVQPAGTGDLQLVRVSQDTDVDGAPDHSLTVPFSVSGACANGVIGCDPGTWKNCTYHRWVADNAGRVSLERVDPTELGGCYCLNRDCGSNLVWQNLPLVLKDLGGGAVGAAQKARPDFSVSQVKVDGAAITYYGQRPGAIGPVTQQAYAQNPGALEGDAQAEVLRQASDPESLYNLTLEGWKNAGVPRNQIACAIRRDVSFESVRLEDIVSAVGGTGQVRPCGGNCIEIVLGIEGDNYWSGRCTVYEEDFRLWVRRPEQVRSATLVYAKWDDYLQVWIGGEKVWSGPNEDFPPETAGPCELSTNWQMSPNLDVTSHFRTAGEVQTKIRVSVTGGGEGFAYVRLIADTACAPVEVTSDTCAPLESDASCQLFDEQVDGVQTVRSGQPTGLVPLPSSRLITNQAGCSRDLNRPWWEKKRTYLCQEKPAFDFSDAKERLISIEKTTSFAARELSYTDKRRDRSGVWVVDLSSISVDLQPAPGACELACKTRRPKENTQVEKGTHVAAIRSDIAGYDFFYRECASDQRCPAGPGEEVLLDCQCIQEFAEAVTVLQALSQAGKDLICSDGVRR